jgi:hypothetical protein
MPQPSFPASGKKPFGSSFELEDFDVLKFEESAWLQAIIAADRWRDATWLDRAGSWSSTLFSLTWKDLP